MKSLWIFGIFFVFVLYAANIHGLQIAGQKNIKGLPDDEDDTRKNSYEKTKAIHNNTLSNITTIVLLVFGAVVWVLNFGNVNRLGWKIFGAILFVFGAFVIYFTHELDYLYATDPALFIAAGAMIVAWCFTLFFIWRTSFTNGFERRMSQNTGGAEQPIAFLLAVVLFVMLFYSVPLDNPAYPLIVLAAILALTLIVFNPFGTAALYPVYLFLAAVYIVFIMVASTTYGIVYQQDF
jgi:hypothetical protein